jgi:hypothetical protein
VYVARPWIKRDIARDADLENAQSEVFERLRLDDVLFALPGDTWSLHDEVLNEELAEPLDIAGMIRLVELLEDRQIFGALLRVVHFHVPSVCSPTLAASGAAARVTLQVVSVSPPRGLTRGRDLVRSQMIEIATCVRQVGQAPRWRCVPPPGASRRACSYLIA